MNRRFEIEPSQRGLLIGFLSHSWQGGQRMSFHWNRQIFAKAYSWTESLSKSQRRRFMTLGVSSTPWRTP